MSTKFHSVNRGRTCFYLTILRVREVKFAELLHGGDVSLVGAGVGRVQQPPGLAQVSRHEVLHGPQLGLAVETAAVLGVQAVASGQRQPQLQAQVRGEPRAGRGGGALGRVDVDLLKVVLFITFIMIMGADFFVNFGMKNIMCI